MTTNKLIIDLTGTRTLSPPSPESLSPKAFRDSLEKLRADRNLYPHVEEYSLVQENGQSLAHSTHTSRHQLSDNVFHQPIRYMDVIAEKSDFEYKGQLGSAPFQWVTQSTQVHCCEKGWHNLLRIGPTQRKFLAGSWIAILVLLVLVVCVIAKEF